MTNNIDISKYMRKKVKQGKIREQARIAFKRWKNGLPITEREAWLIDKWYPFLKGMSYTD